MNILIVNIYNLMTEAQCVYKLFTVMENNGNNNVEQMGILHFHFLENCLWLYNVMCQNSWFISMTSSVFQKKND